MTELWRLGATALAEGYRSGAFDPVEALAVGALAAQLEHPFDEWSEAICRGDWLTRAPNAPPLRAGAVADLVIFDAADAYGWPTRAQSRVVLRAGRVVAGHVPSSWQEAARTEHWETAR